MNYYNENDPAIAAWLKGLISEKLIPNGHVDTRSITEVSPADLDGFIQCHFFTGIGGWPLALALAGWPEDRPVWTGSCPCQPFSVAGKGLGEADPRHLWPVFRTLIAACQPPVAFGEQVASAAGRNWLAGIRFDLEEMGYAFGSADLCAACVGAPHIRQRLFWVADSENYKLYGSGNERQGRAESTNGSRLVHTDSNGCREGSEAATGARYGDSSDSAGFWADSRWIECRDGKYRRIPSESALQPLASRVPYKLGNRRNISTPLIHGAGNAIVPQVAALFIKATVQAIGAQ